MPGAGPNGGSGYSGADPLTDQAAKIGVRLQAAQLLTQSGQGKAAIPALVELLKAPQQAMRLEAAQLLKQQGHPRDSRHPAPRVTNGPKAEVPAAEPEKKD